MNTNASFVCTNGTSFEVSGSPIRLVGANNYYLPYAPDVMRDAVFALAVQMELNTLRTWAFLDCGTAETSGIPGGAKDGVFFHYWNAATNQLEFNDGPNGLEHLDHVIASAERYGLRLILPLANYWPDFGGVDQYLKWFGVTGRNEFFRKTELKQAYRDYVEHLLLRVNTVTGRRYSDEPAILAWELMNEPRCVGDQGQSVSDGIDTLISWIEEMSAFIRDLDANHLLGVGDEGYFCRSGAGGNELYNGRYGVDCERILGIATVDFGTCHLYPSFAADEDPGSFGVRWIKEHIEAGQRANKPMLIEEYGCQTNNLMDEAGRKRRDELFQQWLSQVSSSNGCGALLWMIASVAEDGQQLYPDYDHYTVYAPEDVPAILAFSRNGRNAQERALSQT